MKTTNGGASWVELTNPSNRDLYGITFIDENTGWAVGNVAGVLKTTDGGATWKEMPGRVFRRVSFLDQNYGWAITENEILRSTDGGATWEVQLTRQAETFTDVHIVGGIIFEGEIIAGDGYVIGTEGVWRTLDGINWSLESIRKGTGITSPSRDVGWAVDADCGLWKTSDFAVSWTKQNTDLKSVVGTCTEAKLSFVNENIGWIAFKIDLIFKTSDGGITWTRQWPI